MIYGMFMKDKHENSPYHKCVLFYDLVILSSFLKYSWVQWFDSGFKDKIFPLFSKLSLRIHLKLSMCANDGLFLEFINKPFSLTRAFQMKFIFNDLESTKVV